MYAASNDPEQFHGTHESRVRAIAEAQKEYPGETIYVGECESPSPPEDLWCADDWIEHVSCQDDYSGDAGEDWYNGSEKMEEELNHRVRKVLSDWLDKYGLRPSHYTVHDVEMIEPEVSSQMSLGSRTQ